MKCGCRVELILNQGACGPYKYRIIFCLSHAAGPKFERAARRWQHAGGGMGPVVTFENELLGILAGIDRAKKGASHGTSSKKQ